jgi:hypothetical protein
MALPGFSAMPPTGISCEEWPIADDCGNGNPTQWGAATCGGGYGSGFITDAGTPTQPRGARILGRETPGSATSGHFGASVGLSQVAPGATDVLIAAPSSGDTGTVFIYRNANLWNQLEPRPYQYVAGGGGICGIGGGGIGWLEATGTGEDVLAVADGVDDFNGDGRNDFVVASPASGRLYVAFRRESQLEGDYDLGKIALPLNAAERLDGLLVTGGTGFGSKLAAIDLNDDAFKDIVAGHPAGNGGDGQIVILFAQAGLVSPGGGYSVTQLLEQTRCGPTRAALRITGRRSVPGTDEPGQFGFNVVNAGDVNGDDRDELLVAAPDASPKFDPTPGDDEDAMTAIGVDTNQDGIADNPPGWPVDGAGLVYVIDGGARFDRTWSCAGTRDLCNPDVDCAQDQECVDVNPATCSNFVCAVKGSRCRVDNDCGAGFDCRFGRCVAPSPATCSPDSECASGQCTPNLSIDQLGSRGFGGFIIAGRRADDHLGGGQTGKTISGLDASHGLAGAGDVDGDGKADIIIGSALADPRPDPRSSNVLPNGGEVYLIYGSTAPEIRR